MKVAEPYFSFYSKNFCSNHLLLIIKIFYRKYPFHSLTVCSSILGECYLRICVRSKSNINRNCQRHASFPLEIVTKCVASVEMVQMLYWEEWRQTFFGFYQTTGLLLKWIDWMFIDPKVGKVYDPLWTINSFGYQT